MAPTSGYGTTWNVISNDARSRLTNGSAVQLQRLVRRRPLDGCNCPKIGRNTWLVELRRPGFRNQQAGGIGSPEDQNEGDPRTQ